MIDSETLHHALRAWASGVTVVAAQSRGVRHGMTVNSFTSVALDPPLVLVCIEKNVRTLNLILESGLFAVSVLRADQGPWSDRFAGRDAENSNRFDDVPTHTAITGAPIIADALAYFDCVVESTHNGGNHTILLARVVAAHRAEGEPLLYWNRDYRSLKSEV
ncbi:MAG: flavin reductase family protein [Chloroflexota bacterium]